MMTTFLLDISGTVVRSGGFEAVFHRVYCELLNVEVGADEIRVNTGRKKAHLFAEVLDAHAPDRVDEPGLIDRMTDAFDAFMLQAIKQHPPPVLDGVREAMELLASKDITVGYVTGFARQPAERLLEVSKLDSAVLVGSDEVEHGRPAPDLIHEAMRRLGLADPSALAYAGDTPVDIQSGLAAGCGRVFGLTCGAHDRAELESAARGTPATVLDSLLEAVHDATA
ncbi:MAG: HAD hydrolase-like protein [Phycisphaera sp.]|nr:MAG: HAD hydrolase-like protein [Phycisphaera sp.]